MGVLDKMMKAMPRMMANIKPEDMEWKETSSRWLTWQGVSGVPRLPLNCPHPRGETPDLFSKGGSDDSNNGYLRRRGERAHRTRWMSASSSLFAQKSEVGHFPLQFPTPVVLLIFGSFWSLDSGGRRHWRVTQWNSDCTTSSSVWSKGEA